MKQPFASQFRLHCRTQTILSGRRMASSEEFPGFKITDLTPEERFSVYVKFGWQIFTITVQEIIEIALDKKGPVHYILGLLVDLTKISCCLLPT
jgi:hypothetical protein